MTPSLRRANGNNECIKKLDSDIWDILYTYDRMQIGCEIHLISDWWSFDDDRIAEMDNRALEWWGRWKPILQLLIANNPALPTGKE